jgi:hypothetical protein
MSGDIRLVTYKILHLRDAFLPVGGPDLVRVLTFNARILNKLLEVSNGNLPLHIVYLIQRIKIHVLT